MLDLGDELGRFRVPAAGPCRPGERLAQSTDVRVTGVREARPFLTQVADEAIVALHESRRRCRRLPDRTGQRVTLLVASEARLSGLPMIANICGHRLTLAVT